MLARLGAAASRWAERYVPDPFVFALLLTLVAGALGWTLTSSGPMGMVVAWGRGFWELLEFAMQMSLILVTGHALAHTRPVRRGVDIVAGLPRTGRQAAALVSAVACVSSLVNWGLGLVVGALAAREVGRRARETGVRVHYPLLGAAGYTGLMVWHGGLSGSAPLVVATPDHFLHSEIAAFGWPGGIVPFTATVLTLRNLLATGGAVALAVGLCALMAPREERAVEAPAAGAGGGKGEGEPKERVTAAERLERSFWLVLPFGVAGLGYAGWSLWEHGGQPDIGTINMTFLSLGLLLHGSAAAYAAAIGEAIRGIAGIVLQFPFYAGIMGMMKYSGAAAGPSLVTVLARAAASVSGPATFPALAYLSAAVVNLFVPSGGGQWAVQGPVLIEAAHSLGAGLPQTVMALAYGDQLTNMLQPFWALPLLGITGLRARDVMGYTAVVMLFAGVWFLVVLLL